MLPLINNGPGAGLRAIPSRVSVSLSVLNDPMLPALPTYNGPPGLVKPLFVCWPAGSALPVSS